MLLQAAPGWMDGACPKGVQIAKGIEADCAFMLLGLRCCKVEKGHPWCGKVFMQHQCWLLSLSLRLWLDPSHWGPGGQYSFGA